MLVYALTRQVTYYISDSAGLVAQAARTINVSDTLPPNITLFNSSFIVVEAATIYIVC